MTDRKLMSDLNADEFLAELQLDEQLRDLADLVVGGTADNVSRRSDTGELRIRLDDGEIVHVAAAIVDAYLESRAA